MAVIKPDHEPFIVPIHGRPAGSGILIRLFAASLAELVPAGLMIGASPSGPPVMTVVKNQFVRGSQHLAEAVPRIFVERDRPGPAIGGKPVLKIVTVARERAGVSLVREIGIVGVGLF